MVNIITRRWCYNANNNNKGDREVTKWASVEWWQQLLTGIGIYFSPINFWAIPFLWSTQSNQIRNQLILILLTHTYIHIFIYIYIYIGLWVIRHKLRPKQGFQTRTVHWTVKGRGSRVLRSDRGRTRVELWWHNN